MAATDLGAKPTVPVTRRSRRPPIRGAQESRVTNARLATAPGRRSVRARVRAPPHRSDGSVGCASHNNTGEGAAGSGTETEFLDSDRSALLPSGRREPPGRSDSTRTATGARQRLRAVRKSGATGLRGPNSHIRDHSDGVALVAAAGTTRPRSPETGSVSPPAEAGGREDDEARRREGAPSRDRDTRIAPGASRRPGARPTPTAAARARRTTS